MLFPYIWFLYCIAVQATLVRKHDETFMPDFSLRVTVKNISQGCFFRESVVVNGTSPGPTLRIKPNRVSWIRVYNDMADQNLTMVNLYEHRLLQADTYEVPALAWLVSKNGNLLRWHARFTMAYSTDALL